MLVAGALACAAGAWCAWPVADAGRGERVRVCLVDASASVTRARPSWAQWAASELGLQAREAGARGDALLVAGYGADVVRWFGPGAAAEFATATMASSQPRDGESDLLRALKGIEAMLGDRGRARADLRLIGDRSFTGADPAGELAAWRRDGASVAWIDVPPAELVDLALVRVRLPREIEAGAPLAAACEVAIADGASSDGVAVALEITVTDSQGRRELRQLATVPASAAIEPWSIQCELGPAAPGAIGVEVALRRADGRADPIPEDDVAQARTRTRGALVIGWCANADETFAMPAAAPGLSLVEVTSQDLGAALSELDAVVTLDLDPRALPERELLDFVRRGGGWLACGGYALLEAKSASEPTPLVDTLPLEIDDQDASPRDVVLLVDASGSMVGDAFAAVRTAALELVVSARPADDVQLRFFTTALEQPIELGRGGGDEAQRQRALDALLSVRAAGGGTDVLGALSALALERERSERRALVLLLTDGRDQAQRAGPGDVEAILRRSAQSRVRLVAIAMGAEADLSFLSQFDAPQLQASLVRAEPRELARVFEAELARERVRSGSIAVHATATSDAPVEGAADFARALQSAALPPLEACLRTRAREGDAVVIADDEERPIVAWRREGLGLAGTCATLPAEGWAGAWTGAQSPWAPLLRFAGRAAHGTRPLRASADRDGRVRVENVPDDWPASLAATLRGAGMRDEVTFELGPGSGRDVREGAAPAGALPTDRALELELRDQDGRALAHLGLPPQRAEEFLWPRREVREAPATAAPSDEKSVMARARHPELAALCLGLGLLLLGLGGAAAIVSTLGAARPAPGRASS